MKVLVPLPFDLSHMAHGRNLRIVHLLRELGARGSLVCITPDRARARAAQIALGDRAQVEAAEAQTDSPMTPIDTETNATRLARAVRYFGFEAGLMQETRRRAPDVDVVLGFDLPGVPYLLAAQEGNHRGHPPRVVCDLIDDPWLLRRSFSRAYRFSWAGLKTAACIWAVRRYVLPRFDGLIAVAPRDAGSLARATRREVIVVPNGVTLPSRSASDRHPESDPRALSEPCQPRPAADPRGPMIVFTGAMDFAPNRTAARFLARQVWPRVLASLRARRPGAHRDQAIASASDLPILALVGANPDREIRQLAELPRVTVTGHVTRVTDWLQAARAAVAPMLTGCGIKNKVLEACAAGCPVVATPLGAAGLPAGETNGILLAESAGVLARTIVDLIADPARAARIGRAGRDMVTRQFTWTRCAQPLVRLLERLAPCDPTETTPAAAETARCRNDLETGTLDRGRSVAHAAS